MICTQDRLHFAPAMKAIEQGYPLMLEKPVAPTPEECIQIRDAAEQKVSLLLSATSSAIRLLHEQSSR